MSKKALNTGALAVMHLAHRLGSLALQLTVLGEDDGRPREAALQTMHTVLTGIASGLAEMEGLDDETERIVGEACRQIADALGVWP